MTCGDNPTFQTDDGRYKITWEIGDDGIARVKDYEEIPPKEYEEIPPEVAAESTEAFLLDARERARKSQEAVAAYIKIGCYYYHETPYGGRSIDYIRGVPDDNFPTIYSVEEFSFTSNRLEETVVLISEEELPQYIEIDGDIVKEFDKMRRLSATFDNTINVIKNGILKRIKNGT